MSKIKVNEVQSASENVKLASKGTGLVKVKGAGGDDGTLKLSSGTNGVKIKSPAHSAGQSYTMILPDNNIEAGKFLKVKSTTGSGATAVGQLEYATLTEPDLTNLNASNITSGTLDTARFGSALPASKSALKFVSKHPVGSTAVSEIIINGFEADKMYLLIGKNISMSNTTYLNWSPRDADGNGYGTSDITAEYIRHQTSTSDFSTGYTINRWYFNSHQSQKKGFIVEINNASSYGSALFRGMNPGDYDNKMTMYGSFKSANKRIHSMRIYPDSGNFTENTQILLYEYLES